MLERDRLLKVAVLWWIALADSLGYNLLLNVLPVLADRDDPPQFEGADNVPPGMAYSIFQFTFCFGVALFPPFVGGWSDRLGRRPLLLACLAVCSFSYYIQSVASSFWVFVGARLVCGVSGCLRPLAIAYIADMVTDSKLRCQLITSLSLLSAIAVGFGPSLGAKLLSIDQGFPFLFMCVQTFSCIVLILVSLPEIKEKHVRLSAPVSPSDNICTKRSKYVWTYRYLLALGFSTYFMGMAAVSAFPLSLKEDFKLDPVQAGLCSLADGPLLFISNFLFMKYLTTLSGGCEASIIASVSFGLIALLPYTISSNSLFPFLLLKYSSSIGGPIVFSAIAQTMMGVCPQNVCGSYAGLLTFFHGAGRLTATAIVGPLFHSSPGAVYYLVALTGIVSSVMFWLLLRELKSTMGILELKSPFLSAREDDRPITRQISIMLPGTPSGELGMIAFD
jgi:MFS family permease